ncbi:peroxisome assembly protein 22 [Lodderomyces elongisporus]|uniref:peroxisome assembly protein 22 n=1 Tax=Lodderomyces elongisporus TaxID=36914 RepID=UPI0029255793|nr:peroxisome assembly protein 22 [Lodderomyces elongisporus]WLF78153.1 peroxisome assembly protein 22 [Lodderomyces elongisporus]
MMMISTSRKAQRNPKVYLAALAATSAIAISYKIYETFLKPSTNNDSNSLADADKDKHIVLEGEEEETVMKCEYTNNKNHSSLTQTQLERKVYTISKKFLNKSIAITLSSSFLSSQLPLVDLITSNEKLIYIIPPNLNEEDVGLSNTAGNIVSQNKQELQLPPNFKILKCSNIQGYLQILKNLKPDCLLLCSDDLGISNFNGVVSRDLSNFIKNIINIDQNQDVLSQIRPVFA